MDKIRVVVLEDHYFQRTLLEHNLLSFADVEVYAFGSAQDALSWLEINQSADIIICDLKMPGVDGLSFLRSAKNRFDVTAVALFSSIDHELRRFVNYMAKMLDFHYLGDLDKDPSIIKLDLIIEKFKNIKYLSRKVKGGYLPNNMHSFFDFGDIEIALAQDQFIGFYQPTFYIDSLTVCGAEVLLRWNHPIFGLLTPPAFLDTLIRYNQLDDIFLRLLEQGCRLQQHTQSQGHQISLSYNLDISQLNSTKLVYKIIDIINNYNIPFNSVTFEITEKGFLAAPASNLENLIRLRMQGFELAIDNFGTTYSSLAKLCELPFSMIKLDGYFIRELRELSRSQAAISSVIALSKALNIGLVIGGIETNSQLVLLQQLGCIIGQGYCFSRPLDETEFIQRFLLPCFLLDDNHDENDDIRK